MNSSMERLRKKRQESEIRADELSRLYDISIGINAAMSLETLLRIVAKEATLLLERPWASIVLFNQKQEITHSVFIGLNQDRTMRLDRRMRRGGLNEWLWTHNAPISVEDTTRDKRANCSDFLNHFGIRSIVGFPLATGNQVLGVIYAGDFVPKTASETDMRLLTVLSQQLSVAIEKSRLYDSLERKIKELERNLEASQKANLLKSDFVNHVSHELRTPLTSIKAYVETLLINSKDPTFVQRGEFLEIVNKETNRLIRIVATEPGANVDFTARLIAQRLKESLGQNVVVDNRPGLRSATCTWWSTCRRNSRTSKATATSSSRCSSTCSPRHQVFLARHHHHRDLCEEAVNVVLAVADQTSAFPETKWAACSQVLPRPLAARLKLGDSDSGSPS
jgi:hypothetical protein